MKVHIEYGWPEGRWHGKLLTKALSDSGYEVAASANSADAIIAHSAGCYMMPPDNKAKAVLLIGLPNWPDRPVYKCTLQKIKLETKNKYWFTKTLFHIFYALSLPTTFRTWRAFQRKQINVGKAEVILIRNELDTYMEDRVSQSLANYRQWDYIKIPGQHDDIWENPQPYLEVLTKSVQNF
ncbi:MAG TPA: hypothetical protein VFW52_00485 [Candidatus Saccharimonadales bacterium]|nr:hypothetical protein [Candidatus Saccharimonadales bacterium]